MYRGAQEALTNIERHSGADHVQVVLKGTRAGAVLRISDNGAGLALPRADRSGGLGLRNMAERVEQLDGTLRIMSTRPGTTIEAIVPLTHMLPPEDRQRPEDRRKESA